MARKQSLVFFLIIQMVQTIAALTAFFVMALMLNALNQTWFHLPLCWWRNSNECLVDERLLWYCSNSLLMSQQTRWCWTFPTLLANRPSSGSSNGCCSSTLGIHGTISETISYLVSSFGIKNLFTVAVGLRTFVMMLKNMKIAFFAAGAILTALPICILFFFLQKNFVSGLISGGDKDNLVPPCFCRTTIKLERVTMYPLLPFP